MAENPRSKNTRSKDFRYIYTNGLGAQIGGNEVILIFGIKEDQTIQDNKLQEEVGVIMTHATAKTLAVTLNKVIENYEKATGNNILVDPAAINQVEKAIEEATKRPTASSTSSPPPSSQSPAAAQE